MSIRIYICPVCKERRGVDILYGMPTPEASEAAERGELAIGGCCVPDESPERRCLACGHKWRIKPYVVRDRESTTRRCDRLSLGS